MSVVLNVWRQGGGHITPETGMECDWIREHFPGAVSGKAAWRELKQAKRPMKDLLGAELFMQRVREGRNQIEAPPKNCT